MAAADMAAAQNNSNMIRLWPFGTSPAARDFFLVLPLDNYTMLVDIMLLAHNAPFVYDDDFVVGVQEATGASDDSGGGRANMLQLPNAKLCSAFERGLAARIGATQAWLISYLCVPSSLTAQRFIELGIAAELLAIELTGVPVAIVKTVRDVSQFPMTPANCASVRAHLSHVADLLLACPVPVSQ